MSRRLPTSPLIQGASSLCTAWLQRGSQPTCAAFDSALPALSCARRGFAAVPAVEERTPQRAEALPPSWVPPPNNPETLKPNPKPTLQEIIAKIRQASTPLELHNAYRRKPATLPPPIAAAKFTRLVELLQQQPAAQQQQQQQQAEGAAAAGPSSPSSSAAASSVAVSQPGAEAVLRDVGNSWHTFLHLYTAQQLAACIRAAGHSGLLLAPPRAAAADAASAGADGASAAAGGEPPEGKAKGKKVKSAAAAAAAIVLDELPKRAPGFLDRGLLRRSLDVLLARGGEELQSAGPQAILDVAYGLMRAGHTEPGTWCTLAPLLAKAAPQLGAAGREAGEVTAWLQGKRLPAP